MDINKKIGEVIAFLRIGTELSERGGEAFVAALGDETAAQFVKDMRRLESELDTPENEMVATKAEATTRKLRSMMEQYIGDEWHVPTELLEWLSFFCGAGQAHAALVAAATQADTTSGTYQNARAAQKTFERYLAETVAMLERIGSTNAIA